MSTATQWQLETMITYKLDDIPSAKMASWHKDGSSSQEYFCTSRSISSVYLRPLDSVNRESKRSDIISCDNL